MSENDDENPTRQLPDGGNETSGEGPEIELDAGSHVGSEPAVGQPQPLEGGTQEPGLGPGPENPDNWRTKVVEARERVTGFIIRGKNSFQSGQFKDQLKNLDPTQVGEWVSKTIQGQGFSFYGKLITVILCSWFLADLSALMIGKYIPEPPPSASARFAGIPKRPRTLDDYGVIFTRNLFNSKGIIPGEEGGGPIDIGGAPQKTTLPFNLIGTVILQDELRSLATIEDKSGSMVYPVRVQDEIPQKARILTIEPKRVIFVNLGNQRKEYVDLPEETNANPKITIGTAKSTGAIERSGGNNFNVPRAEVDKALADLNNILTQARAVPHFENGQPAGYKLFQIVPGSIYDKLGLQNGDVIAGFDGQPINDPGKAFEALSKLRETPHLEIQIKRDGRPQTFAYDIR